MDDRQLFLAALAAAIRGEAVKWDGLCDAESWQNLHLLAGSHRVGSLILEAVYRCPDFILAEDSLKTVWKREAMQSSAAQAVRDAAFSECYGKMVASGLHPLVMKGSVCRSLYPDGGLRPSSDEDLLVQAEEFAEAVRFLRGRGMTLLDPQADVETAFEIGFTSPDGLYIELHRSPFSPVSAAMEQCNRFFSDAHSRTVSVNGLLSMCPQDHMLYLLLHAYKHFVHSGFGLRQVCDIALWAQNYGAQINWPQLWMRCEEVRCKKFAQTVFAVARAHLGFDAQMAGVELEPDLPVQALLDDLLDAGVFGSSSGNRVHSATVTLNAVEANRRGEKQFLLRSAFPKRSDLVGRYSYLRKYPALLPVAWCSRLGRYALETARAKRDNSPAESLALGRKRTDLLRQLDLID